MARGRGDSAGEWRRYKKFKEENQRLRKEVSKLRKVINNMFIDQLEERAQNPESKVYEPVCEVCGNNNINIVPITRPDGKFEVKVCKSCGHKSQMKKVKS